MGINCVYDIGAHRHKLYLFDFHRIIHGVVLPTCPLTCLVFVLGTAIFSDSLV